jgi:multidrug resistance efflux pump
MLHHKIMNAFGFPGIVGGNDVGMRQLGSGLNLTFEAGDGMRVARLIGADELDCAGTLQQTMLSQIDVAQENLRSARLNRSYTRVEASVDGYVSNIDFQIGTQAVANKPILALVDSNSFWVFGYFRESQIGEIKLGDTAKVTLMAYPDTPLSGHIESLGWGIAPSDGTVGYNLLPSIKPVFQWIRLAQRIPVRVELDEIPAGVELRFGLTASVMVMADQQ